MRISALSLLFCMLAFAGAADKIVLYKAPAPVVPTPGRFVMPTVVAPPFLNPPGFRWQSEEGVDTYELQVSSDPKFTPSRTQTYAGLKWNIFTPDKPLAEGRWYWRTKANGKWSEPREFTLPAGLPSIPVPPFEQLVAKVDKARYPRIFVTPENIGGLRAKMAGANKTEWERFITGLERRASIDLSDAKPVPGPRAIAANNKIYQETMNRSEEISQLAQGFALAHLLGGNSEHCTQGKRMLLALASWDPNGPTTRRKHDPAFRSIMRGLTRGYDWLRGSGCLTDADRTAVEKVVAIRTPQYLEWFRSANVNNRWPYASHVAGGMVYFGEIATVFTGVLPEAPEWLRFYVSMIPASYPSFGRSDGSWSEGGRYWIGSIDRHVLPMWGLSVALGIPLHRHPFFANTGYFKLYSNPPWGKMIPFGDGHNQQTGTGDGNVVATFAVLLRHPDGAWYGLETRRLNPEKQRTLDAQDILTLDEPLLNELANQSKLDALPLGRVFPDTGLATMRTNLAGPADDVQFMLKSNPYGSVSHAHSDQGNFYLAVGGKPLLIPSGHYQGGNEVLYGSPHHSGYTWQSWAHNVPLVDGRGQARGENSAGQIEHFFTSPVADYVRADATRAYTAESEDVKHVAEFSPELSKRIGSAPLISYRRSALFLRPNVIVLYDDMQTKGATKLDWLLHSWNQFGIEGQTITAADGDAKAFVRLLGNAKITQSNEFLVPLSEKYKKQWHLTAVFAPSDHHKLVSVISARQMVDAKPMSGTGWTGTTIQLPDGQTGFAAFAERAQTTAIDTPAGKVTATAVACIAKKWLYAADATSVQSLRFSRPVDVTMADGVMTITSNVPFRVEGRGSFPAGTSTLKVAR